MSVIRKIRKLGGLAAVQATTPLMVRLRRLRGYGNIRKLDAHLARYALAPEDAGSATLDIGCGDVPRNPFGARRFQGVDIRGFPEHNVIACDLVMSPLPFENDEFDRVTAFDFIEHVPRHMPVGAQTRFPFVDLMNEIHRVLKPGGLFLSYTPAFPYKAAFQDPTHVNIITEDTLPVYFCHPQRHARLYGFAGAFGLVSQVWHNQHLVTLMRKE